MRRRREKREYTGNEIQLVTFTLGHETFAVNVNQVREICRVERITKVPRMPHFIEGVMNLRGQITTIIDMRKLFGTDTSSSKSEQLKIIVAEIHDHQIGLIVDSVKDVIRVSPQAIMPPPKMIVSNLEAQFLTGVCKLTDQLIMLLDVSKIMQENILNEVLAFDKDIAMQKS